MSRICQSCQCESISICLWICSTCLQAGLVEKASSAVPGYSEVSGHIRALKLLSAVGAGGEVGCVSPLGKCLGMCITFCNKVSCQKKKELNNALLFSSRSRITGTTALTSLSIKFWMLSG